MALYTIDYEEGIAGEAPPASTFLTEVPMPGASSINAPGATVYHAGQVAHGAMALMQSPASGDVSYISYGNSSSKNFYATALAARVYFYFTTQPSGAFISMYNNADSWVAGVGVNATGQLFTRDAGANPRSTGTVVLPLNQWLRIELYATIGVGDATMTAAMYQEDDEAPLDLITTSAATTTDGVLSSVRVGKNNYNTYSTPYWVDSVGIDTVATGLVGPKAGEVLGAPFRIWDGSAYQPVDVRVWVDGEYRSASDA